jgi:hypothetical protein
MLAVPVFNDRLPDTPAVPALLINTAALPELVAKVFKHLIYV